jgi:hypothetical protein
LSGWIGNVEQRQRACVWAGVDRERRQVVVAADTVVSPRQQPDRVVSGRVVTPPEFVRFARSIIARINGDRIAKALCAPIWWAQSRQTVVNSGSLRVLKTPEALFGTTNNHVLKIYEKHKAEREDIFAN